MFHAQTQNGSAYDVMSTFNKRRGEYGTVVTCARRPARQRSCIDLWRLHTDDGIDVDFRAPCTAAGDNGRR